MQEMIPANQRTTCGLSALLVSLLVLSTCCSLVYSEKFKLCVVDGRGQYKKSNKYCPILDNPDSKVECVLGVDRLDCLRRISKGTVDFTVLTPEDLVTARNSEIEVLITNKLQYTKNEHEYDVVAIVRDSSGIRNKHHLKDKNFCHPGYGYETDWTSILSNYLEASVVPQICDPKFTLTENRIKASSQYFKSACKAGPWVNKPSLDAQLKDKYPNLCSLCDNPNRCSTSEKYWGRRGPLYCLTDGAGDISWARLDDVQLHFGFVPGGAETTPDGYSYLCPDGTTKPLNSTTPPCVWVVKPWPVIATKRTSAQDIQRLVAILTHDDPTSWQQALLNLIETFHLIINKVEPLQAIESYLDDAPGFLNANSFTGCHPPRTIRICTTSIAATAKCAWMRESAAVYGIEPDLECLKADNTTHCMRAINEGVADVVIVPADLVSSAYHDHHLKTLFYETVNDADKYLTAAIVKNSSKIMKIEEAKGQRACFPVFDGVAWNTVANLLHNKSLLPSCPINDGMKAFFSPLSCIPGLPNSPGVNCDPPQSPNMDYNAIRGLLDSKCDIAFVSKNNLARFVQDPVANRNASAKMGDFRALCARRVDGCHLSWATPGEAMVRRNSSVLWMEDTLDVFQQLDNLFGKSYKSMTTPLQLFDQFDGRENVLFDDATSRLREVPVARNFDAMLRPYARIMPAAKVCKSAARTVTSGWLLVVGFVVFCIKF